MNRVSVQRLQNLLPQTASVTGEDLSIGGCRVEELAEQFGTPLYVYDESTLRADARTVCNAFQQLDARVSYAAKACALLGILRVFAEEGLGLDVVSGGELEAGLRAGFRPERIHLHGNCKTEEELQRALELRVHAVVADNLEELHALSSLAALAGISVSVILRLNLPLEAETHPFLRTSGGRSKFGFFAGSTEYREALKLLAHSTYLQFTGLHVHLGSQIREAELYGRAAEELSRMADVLCGDGFSVLEISLGGGWALPYTSADPVLPATDVARVLQPLFSGRPWRLAVEPGRALVARAGVAVYRVGSVKQVDGFRIVAVDGGMGDNPRPALYGARYSVLPATGPMRLSTGAADLVGRYCESGDVLASAVEIPDLRPGELVCLPVSGAYQLAMASTYNLVPVPAAVMTLLGNARLLARRSTLDDFFSREM